MVETFTPQGDIEQRLADIEQENKLRLQKLQQALSRQTRWRGTPEALLTLALPDDALFEKFQDIFFQNFSARQHLEKDLQQTRAELDRIRAEMDALAAGEVIPEQEELLRKRRHRDTGWELVLDAWEHGMPPDMAGNDFVNGSGAENLPQAYVRAVEEADTLADRLRREAQRVAGYAALKSRLQTTQETEKAILERMEQAGREQEQSEASWQAVWQSWQIVSGTPQEMRAWTGRMSELIRLAVELEEWRSRAGDLAARLQEMRAALVRQMTDAGFPEPAGHTGFAELLVLCRRKIQELQKLEQQRAHLAEQQRAFSATLAQQQENTGSWRSDNASGKRNGRKRFPCWGWMRGPIRKKPGAY